MCLRWMCTIYDLKTSRSHGRQSAKTGDVSPLINPLFQLPLTYSLTIQGNAHMDLILLRS